MGQDFVRCNRCGGAENCRSMNGLPTTIARKQRPSTTPDFRRIGLPRLSVLHSIPSLRLPYASVALTERKRRHPGTDFASFRFASKSSILVERSGATMSFEARQTGARDALQLSLSGRGCCSPRVLSARDRARLAAGGHGSEGNEGRLRRRGLRRMHGGAGAAQGRPARLRAFQRLYSAPRPARRRRADHDRGSRLRRRAASVAAGDGRFSRLAMRLLHARDRDEPVRRLPFRPACDLCGRFATSLRAISAVAPAIARS